MKVLSLFSGVGGFDLGLERAGMETVFQCEWDKHATKILEKHWPHVPRWGDVSTLTGQHILAHAPVIDVVAWGSPCQDLSVAGKRAGLQGARSGLFHEGVRIIKELRELTDGKYPRISIWENVAGALSSGGGADFGQVLYEMDEAGACFSEWRILDAQYFGVPQRRRRVFLISVFDPATAARCPDPLLPVSEGVQWHPATSGTARETVAGTVEQSLASGRGVAEPILIDGRRVDDVRVYDPPVQTLQERMGTGGNNVPVIGFSHTQGLSAQPSETAWPTLRTEGNGMAVAEPIVFQPGTMTRLGGGVWQGTVPTLRAEVKRGDNEPHVAITQPVAFDGFNQTISDVSQTIRADKSDGDHVGMIQQHPTMAVRRLTPIECERLMGWPDNWTDGQADTHRYKQCGNGVASPVAQWIAQQLVKLDQ